MAPRVRLALRRQHQQPTNTAIKHTEHAQFKKPARGGMRPRACIFTATPSSSITICSYPHPQLKLTCIRKFILKLPADDSIPNTFFVQSAHDAQISMPLWFILICEAIKDSRSEMAFSRSMYLDFKSSICSCEG